MKNNAIFTIFKKEFSRFLKDRRTLTALIMPGILIYLIYSLMGGAMEDSFTTDEGYKPDIAVIQMPDSMRPIFADGEIFILSEAENIKENTDLYKQLISEGSKDILMIFPEDFDENVANYNSANGTPAPNIEIYYNSSDTDSTTAYQMAIAILDNYESVMTNKFDINRIDGDIAFDLASDEDITAMTFSMMMPMLLMTLLFSGCMAVAPESIAGEKERGTIASLLITPAKRSHIAIGKILALCLMALISGTSSTVGVMLSLPKLMGEEVTLDGSVYGIADYAMLAVVILSTVLLLITLISIISAFAKTVKEASTLVMPLMLLSMVIGLSGMFGATAGESYLFLIPLYNSVQSMIGIFSFEADIFNMVITVCANLAISALGVLVLTKMFNNERIMFNK